MPRFGGLGRNFNRLGGPGTPGPFGYANLGAGFLSSWKTKLDQVRAGTSHAVVLCLGGSTMRGVGVGTGANFDTGADPFATPKLLADALVANGITAIHNGACGGNLGPTGTDSRVVQNSGWNHDSGFITVGGCNGGTCYNNTTTTNALSFAPTGQFDTIVTWYVRASGRATFTVDVDGGAPLGSINSDGTPTAFLSNTQTCALGTHTVNYKRTGVGGGANVAMIDTYNSSVKAVRVLNCGASSATVSDIATATAVYSSLNAIAAMAPDLVVCAVGGNDCLASTSESSYKTDLQSIVTAVGPGKIILASHTPVNASGAGGEAARQTYTRYTRDVAVTNNVPFVDLTALQGTFSDNNAAGLMANGNHMNDYHSITNYLARAVIV